MRFFLFPFCFLVVAHLFSIEVTSFSDSGAGSLRQAIEDAQAGDSISFNSSGTITLSTPLILDKDLEIDGENRVIISGNDLTSIIRVSAGTITIKSLILKNGMARGSNGGNASTDWYGGGGGGAGMGGAIFLESANLIIENVVFQNNKAIGGNGGSVDYNINLPSYAGSGGNSSLGTGGGQAGQRSSNRNAIYGRAGGFGGGGGGGADYSVYSYVSGYGGVGGFGGGGGGAADYANTNSAHTSDYAQRGLYSEGGEYGGRGGEEALNSGVYPPGNEGGPGGGGAGLGAAIFAKSGTLYLVNSSFVNNQSSGGSAGLNPDVNHLAEDGQGAGGALFAYQDATIYALGSVDFSNNSPNSLVVMSGAEYDTTQSTDTDSDGIYDILDDDDDGDMLLDAEEIIFGSNPLLKDTDNDGVSDLREWAESKIDEAENQRTEAIDAKNLAEQNEQTALQEKATAIENFNLLNNRVNTILPKIVPDPPTIDLSTYNLKLNEGKALIEESKMFDDDYYGIESNLNYLEFLIGNEDYVTAVTVINYIIDDLSYPSPFTVNNSYNFETTKTKFVDAKSALTSIVDEQNAYDPTPVPTQSLESYVESLGNQLQAISAERDAKLTVQEVEDLRAGSTMIEIENGTATLSMEVEQSVDLGVWTNESSTSIQIPIQAGEGKKFFRFKMSE